MENVINLVKSMLPGEIKLLKHFYKYQEGNDSKKINLLFDFAIRSKACKKADELDQKAFKLLYNNSPKLESTFVRLKFRLKNDIFNILLLQDSSTKFMSKHDLAIFDCRKMLTQGEILLGRGIYNEGISMLEKASAIALKNELFAEQILIAELCRNYNLLRLSEQEFSNFMDRIEKNTAYLEKVQFAKHFHYEMTASRLFKTTGDFSTEEWKCKLAIIKKDYEQTKSVKHGFYYNLSALNYHRDLHEFDKSLEFGQILLKNAETQQILKTPYYSGKINLELAKCYLLTEDFDKAIHYARISGEHFQNDLLNELSALEILLHCYLIRQDHKKVNAILATAFEKITIQSDEFIHSKWSFLKAGIEFRMNDYHASLQTLKKCNELLKDKNGWLLAYNLFEVICRIENGNLEWMEYRSEALKKIMHRYNRGHAGKQNTRFEMIYQVLRTLHKNNYDYVLTMEMERESIDSMSQSGYFYSWYMSSYEPVPFDQWIKGKAEHQLKNRKSKSVA